MPFTDVFMTQVLTFSGEEAKRGSWGCRHPPLRVGGLHCHSEDTLGIPGDQVPRPPPGSVLVGSSVRSAFSPRTSFLSMASLMPKRMRVRTFFRSFYCAHPCAQEGRTRPCRAFHLFSVRSCPGRRNGTARERAICLLIWVVDESASWYCLKGG